MFLHAKTAVWSGKMLAMISESCRVSALSFRRSGGRPRSQEGFYPIEGAPGSLAFRDREARRAELPETHPIGQLPASEPRSSLRFDFHGPAHPRLMHCENTPIANPSAVRSESPIPGPQRRGILRQAQDRHRGALIRVGESLRDRGQPPRFAQNDNPMLLRTSGTPHQH